jgi:hypothetical protein
MNIASARILSRRDAGENNSGNTMFRRAAGPKVARGFVRGISTQRQKAPTNCLESTLFIPLAAAHIRIKGHSPQQDRSGRHFDEAVDSKANKGNAAGHHAAITATTPSSAFHSTVKYSSLRPWRTAAVRSKTAVSAMPRVYNAPVQGPIRVQS